jgi:hypothetical protein
MSKVDQMGDKSYLVRASWNEEHSILAKTPEAAIKAFLDMSPDDLDDNNTFDVFSLQPCGKYKAEPTFSITKLPDTKT